MAPTPRSSGAIGARGAGDRAARVVVRAYFAVAYGLLLGSDTGRRFLEVAATGDGPAVHGYLTPDDLEALFASLRPANDERLLDLGCGTGSVALEVHRRSGAQIVGVDSSGRAIAQARNSAEEAGVAPAVRFVVGDLAHPPLAGAASAYAIDSLMFAPDLSAAIRGIGGSLDAGGRLFATVLIVGPKAAGRLRSSLETAGVAVEALDDVSGAFVVSSRRRAGVARAQLGAPTSTLRGCLAMLLVVAEEALVGWAVARDRLSRWRFVVRYDARGA